MSTTGVVGSVVNADTYSLTPGNRKAIVCSNCFVTVAGSDTNEDTVATLLNDESPKNFEELYYQSTPCVCRLNDFSIDVNVTGAASQKVSVSVALAIIADNSGTYNIVKYLTRNLYALFGGGSASEDLEVEEIPQFVLHTGENLAVVVVNSLSEAAGDNTCVAAVSLNGTVSYTQ